MITEVSNPTVASDVHVKTDDLFGVLLGVLFFLVYTQGYIERVGVPYSMVKMAIEVPVFGILLHLINRGIWQPAPGLLLIAFYVMWTVLSAIFNGDEVYSAFLYCRYVVYAYIVFTAVWATPLTKTAVARVNKTIILLFLLQIVASAYEAFVQGERVEAHVGALYADGGAMATEFPLLAMGLTLPFYLYYRKNPLVLLLAWAFFLVGYASGKRAIYFFAPSLYFFILGWYVFRVGTRSALKRSLGAALAFMLVTPVLLLGVSRSHGISQDHSRSWLDQVGYALNAAEEYTTAEGQTGRTMGRTATNRRVLSTLGGATAETLLLGWGPSAMRVGEEERYEVLMITYGICGWVRDVICIGWPGMVIYLLFHLRVFCCLRSAASPRSAGYWTAIRFGAEIAFFVILASYISYSDSFPVAGQFSYVYFYVLALLISPRHRHIVD